MQSFLIHTNRGLERRYCPFKVVVKASHLSLKKGDVLMVTKLSVDENNVWLYQLNGQWYLHIYFIIL